MTPRAQQPVHVPDELVVDFDYHDIAGADDDVQRAWLDAVVGPGKELFWTPHNGGHWVLTQPEDIETVQRDYDRFSNRNYQIPKTPRRYRPLPLGADPPEHRGYRALIAPAFSPRAVRDLSAKARALTIDLVGDLAPAGYCEFVSDFAKVLPIVVFLGIMDLPEEDREVLTPFAEAFVRGRTVEDRTIAAGQMADYLETWIDRRSADPGDDLLSHVAQSNVAGRAITRDEIFGLAILVMNGGLDTVATMLTMAMRHLALHDESRRRLVSEPQLIPHAVEELIRRHGIVANAREVVHDITFRGVELKAGDMVQIPTMIHGLSDETVDRPLEVDFDRPQPIPHANFGNGVHKCPGANLARQEMTIALQEWLARIPEFRMRRGSAGNAVTGSVSTLLSLELEWDPIG